MNRRRGLSVLILGIWLGAGVFADVAVTQNFQAVDRFLAQPSSELNGIAHDRERLILRRNAAEENNVIFTNWERVELVVGVALLLTLPQTLAGPLVLLAIVAAQHFFLSPAIAEMGRQTVITSKFWMYHGIYSGSEIVKLLIAAALAWKHVVNQHG